MCSLEIKNEYRHLSKDIINCLGLKYTENFRVTPTEKSEWLNIKRIRENYWMRWWKKRIGELVSLEKIRKCFPFWDVIIFEFGIKGFHIPSEKENKWTIADISTIKSTEKQRGLTSNLQITSIIGLVSIGQISSSFVTLTLISQTQFN